jgi:hypothetical protein
MSSNDYHQQWGVEACSADIMALLRLLVKWSLYMVQSESCWFDDTYDSDGNHDNGVEIGESWMDDLNEDA